MDLLAVLIGVSALALASIALALVLRARRSEAIAIPDATRLAAGERRLTQLERRLDVLEGDVDLQRRPSEPASLDPASLDPLAAVVRRSSVALSHIGLVRFDAFEDTGGGQSFALALLDDEGDGVILTSLHSRQMTRLYAKGIRGGVADVPLSEEEERALREAGLVP